MCKLNLKHTPIHICIYISNWDQVWTNAAEAKELSKS